jgi:DNA-binding IclR family transcriptional regulator
MRVVKGAVDRSLQVIESLARETRRVRMSAIAAELEREKSPAHRVLLQSRKQGRAERDEHTSQYCLKLTLTLSSCGQRYLHGQSMDSPVTLHATANGTVWLASMPNDRAIECALGAGLGKAASRACWPKAINSIEQLIPELELTRQRGYGLVVEEAEPGVAALAVPVQSLTNGTVVGTMSMAGPVMHVQPERYDDFVALMKEATSKLGAVLPRESVGANVREAA